MTHTPTPYDLVFGAPGFDEARFDQLAEEDGGRAAAPAELLMLPTGGALLREMLPADVEGTAHVALVRQVGALLFHAYRFRLHGRCVYRLTPVQLQPLLDGTAPPPDWQFRVPGPAGYVQLPRNALWARADEGVAPEPVDGFFWNAPEAAADPAPAPDSPATGSADSPATGSADSPAAPDPPGVARLDLLLALGVRAGRPGLSLVPVSVEAPATLEQWARVEARPDGTDFANVLPGGELQGYHALTTQAEVLKLAVLCFWHLDTVAADG
jgi:hypothetical protein